MTATIPAGALYGIIYRMEKRENYAAARDLVAGARRILVSGHLSPDGDSLGSMLALARLLRNAGKEAYATADLNALGKPGFLEGVEELIPVRKLKAARSSQWTAAPSRACRQRWSRSRRG